MNNNFHILDSAKDVSLNSSFPSNSVLLEYTEITFICTADSNPLPVLSIVLDTGWNIKQISAINGSSLVVGINVTKEYNGGEIYCEVTGSDPAFSVVSANYVYTIKCE